MEERKIFRAIDDYMIAGVCGGLAKYFKIDSSLMRIIFVLLALSGGSGVFIYLILWLVVPKEKEINREEKIREFTDDIKSKAKSMAKEMKTETKIKKTKRVNLFGIVLILVGIVAIWNQMFPIRIEWNFFWPGLLILMGILVLFRE